MIIEDKAFSGQKIIISLMENTITAAKAAKWYNRIIEVTYSENE